MDGKVRTVDPARIARIIDAAAQLFAERHFHEVRMDDIAAKANVAKGTIYLHFKDKDDLYRALAIDSLKKLSQRIHAATEDLDDPAAKLLGLHREVVRFFEHNAFTLDLINRVDQLKNQAGSENNALLCLRADFMKILRSILEQFPQAAHRTEFEISLAVHALSGMTKEVVHNLPAPWPNDLAERLTALFIQGFIRTEPSQPAEGP
jgi:AcrR family transcriptional regulator